MAEAQALYEPCHLCEQPVRLNERNFRSGTDTLLRPVYCSPPCTHPMAVEASISAWAEAFRQHESAAIALASISARRAALTDCC